MVVSLGPGKFYGTSLPRPRFYTDVKLNDERVDPPTSVLDPLLSWAHEAHWSMGGLNFKRVRLQGRIEGSVSKLRAQREKEEKKKQRSPIASSKAKGPDPDAKAGRVADIEESISPSPPRAPIATKRRRFLDLMDDDEQENEEVEVVKKRRLVKKLGDDFDRVALEGQRRSPSTRSRDRRSEGSGVGLIVMNVVHEVKKSLSMGEKLDGGSSNKGKKDGENQSASSRGTRSSPRLAMRRSN